MLTFTWMKWKPLMTEWRESFAPNGLMSAAKAEAGSDSWNRLVNFGLMVSLKMS